MPGTLPKVFNGIGFAQYPVTREIVFDTRVDIAANGSEQRFVNNVPLFRFKFPYNSLLGTDQAALLAFFNTQMGAAFSDWSAVLGTQTYANLAFDHDTVQFSQIDPLLWSLQLGFRQTQNPGYPIPSAGAFPVFTSGKRFQRPFAPVWRNLTAFGDSPTGTRYAYRFYGAGLTGFPTTQLRGWELSYPVLSDADVAILEQHFVGSQGRLASFDFYDDQGTLQSFCRYGTDVLSLSYLGPNRTQAAFSVLQFSNIT